MEYLCAGIIRPLIRENMIDEYCISVIPTILGGGIPLFGDGEREIKLRLKCTETYNGITELSKTFDRQIHAFVIKIYMQGDRKWNWENRLRKPELHVKMDRG